MRFKRHRKIKRYKKTTLHEFAIIFNNSNQLIDYVCRLKSTRILRSSLYTKDGYYQLLITANATPIYSENAIFKDKLHIDEIILTCHPICKCEAVFKIKKAFKAP